MGKNKAVGQEILWWGVIFVMLFFAASLYKDYNGNLAQSSTEPEQHVQKQRSTLDKVNSNLQETELHSTSIKQQVELKNNYIDSRIGNGNVEELKVMQEPVNDHNLQIQPDNAAVKIFEDLNPRQSEDKTLDMEFSSEVAVQQWIDSYDEQNKQLFIKAVQRIAKKKGFEIKFDKNYKIKSFRKLYPKRKIHF